jgi:hypothetical protein
VIVAEAAAEAAAAVATPDGEKLPVVEAADALCELRPALLSLEGPPAVVGWASKSRRVARLVDESAGASFRFIIYFQLFDTSLLVECD